MPAYLDAKPILPRHSAIDAESLSSSYRPYAFLNRANVFLKSSSCRYMLASLRVALAIVGLSPVFSHSISALLKYSDAFGKSLRLEYTRPVLTYNCATSLLSPDFSAMPKALLYKIRAESGLLEFSS